MINIFLNTSEADIISNDKINYTYFLKNPIVLKEDYYLYLDNYYYNGGSEKIGISSFKVQDNGNYAFNEAVFNNVGQSYNIDLSLHNANVSGIIKIKLIKPQGFSAYMIADGIINKGGDFTIGQVITLNNSLLPFYKDPASVPLKIEILSVETYNTLKKLNIKIDNLNYDNNLYNNNDNLFIPSILEVNKFSINNNEPVLCITPQIINNIKLIIKNYDEVGLQNNDNIILRLILKKKNLIKY